MERHAQCSCHDTERCHQCSCHGITTFEIRSSAVKGSEHETDGRGVVSGGCS
ncbi:hypothetical protein LEMLEM_LOCUS11235 [Lemmus lemmus]